MNISIFLYLICELIIDDRIEAKQSINQKFVFLREQFIDQKLELFFVKKNPFFDEAPLNSTN